MFQEIFFCPLIIKETTREKKRKGVEIESSNFSNIRGGIMWRWNMGFLMTLNWSIHFLVCFARVKLEIVKMTTFTIGDETTWYFIQNVHFLWILSVANEKSHLGESFLCCWYLRKWKKSTQILRLFAYRENLMKRYQSQDIKKFPYMFVFHMKRLQIWKSLQLSSFFAYCK